MSNFKIKANVAENKVIAEVPLKVAKKQIKELSKSLMIPKKMAKDLWIASLGSVAKQYEPNMIANGAKVDLKLV